MQVADLDGEVLFGSSPDDAGQRMPLHTEPADRVTTWTGDLDVDGEHSIAVQVPLYAPDADGEPPQQVGIVMVTDVYPSVADRAEELLPDLVTFLGIGLGLGLLGAWLLARLIKRRTRGLEPAEIAALADQREALLHSIREGVVAVATDGTVTVLSDSARELVGLPETALGRRLDELDLEPGLREALVGDDEVHDRVLVLGERVVVLNRNRVVNGGRQVGTVTTLRDRTELMAMQSELTARESITETLRAQTHEFNNQLHTISGLVQLEEYDEVSRVIGALTRRRAEINEAVTKQVQDPAVAALLIAKVSLAAERGVEIAARGGRPAAAAGARSCPPTSAPCWATSSTTPSTQPWPPAADASTYASCWSATPSRCGWRTRGRECRRMPRARCSAAGSPPSRRLPEVVVSGWRSCRWSASAGAAAVSVHNDAGAVFTAVLPVQGGGAR